MTSLQHEDVVPAPPKPLMSVLFTTSDDWESGIIRAGTKSECSHCAVLFVDGNERVIYEMAGGGCRTRTTEAFGADGNRIVFSFAVTDPAGVAAARQYADVVLAENTKYDFAALFGEVYVQGMKDFGHAVTNPFAATKMMICSRFALDCLRESGYRSPAVDVLDPKTVWPGQLMDALKSA